MENQEIFINIKSAKLYLAIEEAMLMLSTHSHEWHALLSVMSNDSYIIRMKANGDCNQGKTVKIGEYDEDAIVLDRFKIEHGSTMRSNYDYIVESLTHPVHQ